jgi:hypothetical protein
MSRRNVWLSFSEWEQISEELSHRQYHQFELNRHELKDWKDTIENCKLMNCGEPQHCFSRVGIYPAIEEVKTSFAFNVLCRENYREQDMCSVMHYPRNFIGFIINYSKDVNMNTTFEKWEEIRNEMKKRISESEKRIWFIDDLIDLYQTTQNDLSRSN